MQAKPAGIIDTLAAGFGTVNRHLWIILIPFLLDLLLWLSPRVSAANLASQAADSYRHWVQSSSIRLPGSDTDSAQSEQGLDQAAAGVSRINVLGLLAWRMPSVIGPLDAREGRTAGEIAGWWQLVVLLSLLALGGMLLASLYLGALARYVAKGSLGLGVYLRRIPVNWDRLIAFSLVIALAAAVLGMPVAVVLGLLSSINVTLGLFAATLVGIAALVVMFFLFLVDEAIFVGDQGVLPAIRSSVYIVDHNKGPGLRLLIASYLILIGCAVIWSVVSNNNVGRLIAFAANSYVATSLVAASMMFYKQRSVVPQPSQSSQK